MPEALVVDFNGGRCDGRADTLVTLILTTRASRHSRCSPDTAGWWARLLVALLFAFYVSFIPIHLATERHLDGSGSLASVGDSALHHDGHDDGDDDADSDHHAPHHASDHTLTFTASVKAPSASALAVLFLPAVTSILVAEPEPQPPVPVFERIRPPGESPPGPRQPRAPPLA